MGKINIEFRGNVTEGEKEYIKRWAEENRPKAPANLTLCDGEYSVVVLQDIEAKEDTYVFIKRTQVFE